MWKYYRALHLINQKNLSQMEQRRQGLEGCMLRSFDDVHLPNANLEEGFQKLHEIIIWFISLIMTFVIQHVKMCVVSIQHCPRFAVVVS